MGSSPRRDRARQRALDRARRQRAPDHASRAVRRFGERIDSPFFTADVARLASGGYTVLEINDGGSSTLPEQLDPREVYRAIARG
ncbi:MAG: ATP-grasp domain-containing protein [Myxococcales bacterium]|nr:ATP-grasp domain-containing protein [Myxococcales bacterium]